MWRLKSFTFWFNVCLLGAGAGCPGLSEQTRTLLIGSALGNLGLREKTAKGIKNGYYSDN